MVTSKEFARFAESQAGKWCYVWGGNGTDMTAMDDRTRKSWITKQEKRLESATYPLEDRISDIEWLYSHLTDSGVNPVRGGDCSGFVYWCLKELGLQKSDLSSRGFFGICKQIDEADLRAGDLLFRWTDKNGDGAFQESEIVHIGIYLGNGRSVDCAGRKKGVLTNLTKGAGWQVFGRLKYFVDEVADTEEKTELDPSESLDGDDIPLTDPVPSVEVVGGSVHVRDSGSTFGKKLGTAHRGDRYPLRDWSGEGWYRIDYNGRIGYISNKPKYTKLVDG